jgi:urease accessory protein
MEIIRHSLAGPTAELRKIAVPVDRLTLAKRRWRGVAEDGRELGFDLEESLHDGDAVLQAGDACYVIAQAPELVLEVRLQESGSAAARLGWLIGNLHFQMEVTPEVIRVADDPALRQLFTREGIAFVEREAVFHPLGGGHSHGHHDH